VIHITEADAKTFGNCEELSDVIRTERVAAGVTRICLDRPEARNALRPADLDALRTAIVEAADPVVLVEGAGAAFCAGADLNVVADLDDPAAFAARGQRTARAIESAASVVIAGVDGPARGGGVELALACDLRVATPDASFAESGIGLGLFGAWGGTHRLPRAVGPAVARDLMLSGRVVDATEARRMGLVSRVVDDPAAVATAVAEHPEEALVTVKRLLRGERSRLEHGGGAERAEAADRAGGAQRAEAAEREAFAALHAAHVGESDTESSGESDFESSGDSDFESSDESGSECSGESNSKSEHRSPSGSGDESR
jgi:enoyl-CoA hydratase/carnithine racemase